MTPAQSQTAAIRAWFNDWQHTILACVCLVCAVCAGVFVPIDRWEKLGRYLSDPATAVTFTAIGGVFVALYRRARGLPPAILALVLAASTMGCGASALQGAAVGVTVALRAEEAVSAVVVADLDRRMDACPAAEPTSSADAIAAHNACVDRERASVADLTDALSAIELSIRAVGAGIATAAEVDAGQPIPAILLDTLREVLALWDRVDVALRAHGITVPPEIGLVVAALGAIVGPAS